MNYPIIPTQLKGDFHEIVNMKCEETEELAKSEFKALFKRLLLVNEWHSLSDDVKEKFTLTNHKGIQQNFNFEVDNFVNIDLPGPGNPSGEGLDWTQIVDIQNNVDDSENPFFAFTLKPCVDPKNNNEVVAHFFTSNSSNTFIIRRIGTCIYAEVHGRNEENNTSNVPVLDKIRNKAITVGAKLGLSGMNWQVFTNSLINPERHITDKH